MFSHDIFFLSKDAVLRGYIGKTHIPLILDMSPTSGARISQSSILTRIKTAVEECSAAPSHLASDYCHRSRDRSSWQTRWFRVAGNAARYSWLKTTPSDQWRQTFGDILWPLLGWLFDHTPHRTCSGHVQMSEQAENIKMQLIIYQGLKTKCMSPTALHTLYTPTDFSDQIKKKNLQ